MKLNKEELIIASVLTSVVIPFPIALGAIPVCAFFWALSGSESEYNWKVWRRLGVPLVWALCLWKWQALLLVPIGFGFLCLGYGIPTTQPVDEGSALGRFFFKITRGNVLLSNTFTRGLIYIGLVTPFLIVRFI